MSPESSAQGPDATHPPPIEAPHTQGLRLQVRHRTRFEYKDHAFDSFNEARLCPITDPLQSLEFFSLKVLPEVAVTTYHDFHHNRVDHFEIVESHAELDVQSLAIVQTIHEPRGAPPLGLTLDSLYERESEESFFDFLTSSKFVSLEAAVWREAIDALPNGVHDLWLDSVAIGSHIYRTCEYVPRSTNAKTHMIDALQARRGVCQDFAHIMLAMCRSQGIPARYVSGYFYNENSAPDENEASHAWVEVFLPGYGWKGFDPTHNRLADTRYLKLAVGRDYADIEPVKGAFRGKGTRHLSVEVRITLAD
jgi:transglutaminase-like putative cysteine protease